MLIRRALVVTSVALVSFACFPPLTADPDPGFGTSKDGLALGLRITDQRELVVTLRNEGKKDRIVNLGMTLANGRRHYPSSLSLKAVDASGKAFAFELMLPPIGGRVDDYLVPLRVKSRHVLRLQLSELWSPQAAPASKLAAGDYSVTLLLESEKPRHVNGDMVGVGLMNVWSGNLVSATVAMKIS